MTSYVYLVSIHTSESSPITYLKWLVCVVTSHILYISGLNDKLDEGYFQFITGDPTDNQFSKWAGGYPQRGTGEDNGKDFNCVELSKDNNYHWVVTRCTKNNRFICEKTGLPIQTSNILGQLTSSERKLNVTKNDNACVKMASTLYMHMAKCIAIQKPFLTYSLIN